MLDRSIHVEPLERPLFARHDNVHVIATAETMVGHGQERIGVGREIDTDDLGFLVDDVIDKAGILMTETVVILPPDVGGQQIIQEAIGRRHGIWLQTLSHLAC